MPQCRGVSGWLWMDLREVKVDQRSNEKCDQTEHEIIALYRGHDFRQEGMEYTNWSRRLVGVHP